MTLGLLPSVVSSRIALMTGRGLEYSVADQARHLGLTAPDPAAAAVVTEDDLATLPEPVQRYLRFMGVPGRPRDRSFRASLSGRFRRGRDDAWMHCEAWQYNTVDPVTRLFHMRIDFAGVVPMVGRDTYQHGAGRMHGTVLGLVTVVDGQGEPFDVGELTTFVNDALVLAPSMLLGPETTWRTVDDGSFEVAFTDGGRTVSAVVLVDDDGAMRDFHTTDRFFDGPDGPVRAQWRTPIDGWRLFGGRRLPTRCQAVWELDDGPLPYVDGSFVPGSVAWNVAP